MRNLIITLIVLAFVGVVLASSVFTECSALPGTDRVTITWITKTESGVTKFQVLRSSDARSYIQIHEEKPTGPGSRYEYIDQNVMFKGASTMFYKVRAVNSSGSVLDEQSMLVNPNISGIFRTWGAIKAMFR